MWGPDRLGSMTNIEKEITEEAAVLAKVLGHAHRLNLLEQIAQGERPVERLAELSGLSIANASQHLQHLKRSGLVVTRREGKRIYYSLGSGPILEIVAALSDFVAHRQTEFRALVDDHANRRDQLDAITREELLERMAAGDVTVLDVRPREEFGLGHLPGAVNIPFEELERRLAELPPSQDIVAYCRGPNCLFSVDAARLLKEGGRSAAHLENGFPDWKVARLPVEVGI